MSQTNSPATILFGQDAFDGYNNLANRGSIKNGLYYPSDVTFYDGKLYVVDYYSHRILRYDTLDNYSPPTLVIGQSDLYNTTRRNVTSSALYSPRAISIAKNQDTQVVQTFVGDNSNNRILIFNGNLTQNNPNATIVIGQPDMTSSLSNNGGVSNKSINGVYGLHSDGKKLAIADIFNHRILLYNSIPTVSPMSDSNAAGADVVIGQTLMSNNSANSGGAISASSLYYPMDVTFFIDPNSPVDTPTDKTRMFIADYMNNRVLIFNTIPTSSGQAADVVIGQPTMTTGTYNNNNGSTTVTGRTLSYPQAVYTDGDRLMIADTSNNRVLIYNSIPTTNHQYADIVIGQPNFTSNTANNDSGLTTARTLYNPEGITTEGNKLFITDYVNHRVLIYNNIPTTNFQPADSVIGQPNMNNNLAYAAVADARSISTPVDFSIYNNKLLITDMSNSRILVFNSAPTTSNQAADRVIGQPDMYASAVNTGGISAQTLNAPNSTFVDNGRLFIGDYANNRVLIFNSIPEGNNGSADYVIGQPNMASNTPNNGGVNAKSLQRPQTMATKDNILFVTDTWNNRVMAYDLTNISSVAPNDSLAAFAVIGQGTLTSNSYNYGGLNAKSMIYPRGIKIIGEDIATRKLLVSDCINKRILIYNYPISTYMEASVVLGQSNFTSGGANTGGISASRFYEPVQIYSDGIRLFVADYYNYRVLIWNSIPTVDNQPADVVIGQPSFTERVSNNGGLSNKSLGSPYSMVTSDKFLYVADTTNNRILGYPLGPQNTSVTLTSYVTTLDHTITLAADDAKDMMISKDSNFAGAVWESFATTKDITLDSVEGMTTYFVKMRDFANYESDVFEKNITYDISKPTGSVAINSEAEYTNKVEVELTVNAQDEFSPVSQIMISNENTFTNGTWETFSTTIPWTINNIDGVSTVFVKFKDAAGNISEITSDDIILDTIAPPINIKDLGLITSVPVKDYLFYYFTSQTPRIKGETEAISTVHYKYESNDYTTTADQNGNYEITIPKLPREEILLKYYAVDKAGNMSNEKTLKLLIGKENFPVIAEPVEISSEPIIEETINNKVDELPQTGNDLIKTELYEILVTDKKGNILKNTSVTINGQEYVTDKNGKIYIEKKLTADMEISAELQGKSVKGSIAGATIILTALEKKNNLLLIVFCPVLLIIIIIVVMWIK
ncbi:MAG: NHL repeat-containing protein [bacterium]